MVGFGSPTYGNGFGGSLRPAIPGRFVNSPSDISPNEIPTDGSLCLFPKSDYTCIYARQWGQNGIIEATFVPENRELPQQTIVQQTAPIDFSEVNERLDKIEKMLRNRKPQYSKRKDQGENNGK